MKIPLSILGRDDECLAQSNAAIIEFLEREIPVYRYPRHNCIKGHGMENNTNVDPYSLALDKIDVSNPWHYRDNTIAPYFERLHREAPVHYCADSAYGPYWSLTKYDDIFKVNAADDLFSCDYELGRNVLG